jgi:hypothetical protein
MTIHCEELRDSRSHAKFRRSAIELTNAKEETQMASPKQVSYLLRLLDGAGYDTRFMSSAYKELGATMSERKGSVEGWLTRMSGTDASHLIDRLKKDKAVTP